MKYLFYTYFSIQKGFLFSSMYNFTILGAFTYSYNIVMRQICKYTVFLKVIQYSLH